jgi:hypothetical protein
MTNITRLIVRCQKNREERRDGFPFAILKPNYIETPDLSSWLDMSGSSTDPFELLDEGCVKLSYPFDTRAVGKLLAIQSEADFDIPLG